MAVTLSYITERHAYWMERIARAGVWKAEEFDRVTLRVKPPARTLNGKFMRRVIRSRNPLGIHGVEDTLIVYDNPWLDTPVKIDSVLVHEMIHQYIYQARLRDTSSHGRRFRSFMQSINRLFSGELHLSVSERAPREQLMPRRKAALHTLALVEIDGKVYCCRVMPSALPKLTAQLSRLVKRRQISGWRLYSSTDSFFDGISACRTRLHGLRMSVAEVPTFITTHALQPILM